MGYLGGLEAIWLRDAKDLASMAGEDGSARPEWWSKVLQWR